MTALIYTHPPDYVMAAHVARAWQRLGLRAVLAIDAADPQLAVEGVEVIRTAFDRQRNLNGREFILGHLGLMEEFATGAYSVKCDSDTMPLNLDWLGDRTAIAYGIYSYQLQGRCYALRVDDLPALREDAERTLPRGKIRLMEDQVIGELAKRNGTPCFRVHDEEWTGHGSWRPERDRAWCEKERVSLLNFPLRRGDGYRRVLAAAMKDFLP